MRRVALMGAISPMRFGGIGQTAKAPHRLRRVIKGSLPELLYFEGDWNFGYQETTYTGGCRASGRGEIRFGAHMGRYVGGITFVHLLARYEGPFTDEMQPRLDELNLNLRGTLSDLPEMLLEWHRRMTLMRSLFQHYEQFDPLLRIPEPSLRSEEWESEVPFSTLRGLAPNILSPLREAGPFLRLCHLVGVVETSRQWEAELHWDFNQEYPALARQGLLKDFKLRIFVGRSWPADERWLRFEAEIPKNCDPRLANHLTRMCGQINASCIDYQRKVLELSHDLNEVRNLLVTCYGVGLW